MNVMTQALLVGFGGFAGSVLRFLVGGWAQRLVPGAGFPVGTLAVNVAGCLAIGFLGGLVEHRQLFDPAQRLFVLVGILGGFTTFSTFAFETLALGESGAFGRALLNIAAQLVLGLAAAAAGFVAARWI